MNNHSLDNRVRLAPSVYCLLSEAARLSGRSRLEIASEAIREYLSRYLKDLRSTQLRANLSGDLSYWQRETKAIEDKLRDLKTYQMLRGAD